MGRCPKCSATGDAIWEDNFWSGCRKCGWTSSCEGNIVVVPRTPVSSLSPSLSTCDEDEDDADPRWWNKD
jgi:hypothetical protein